MEICGHNSMNFMICCFTLNRVLYSNNITSLPSDLFKDLYSLRELYIEHNSISKFPSRIFRYYRVFVSTLRKIKVNLYMHFFINSGTFLTILYRSYKMDYFMD